MLRPLKRNVGLCVRGSLLITIVCLALVYRLSLVSERIKKTPGIIYMLQWTGSKTEPFSFMRKGVETFMERKCPVMNCFVTSNRKLLDDITNFDVVLFHGKEIIERSYNLPTKRSYRQRYVFASMESSGYYPVPSSNYDDYFNLTWTYKLDSDIDFGYMAIRNRNGEIIGPSEEMHWMSHEEMSPINDTLKNKIANKTIAAAWFVSNCHAPSKRHRVVAEIESEMKDYGLSVDVYGKCGDKRCPLSSKNDCLKLIEQNYYFYFAFENSFAEDYVTEKLLNALNHYAVPVVFGGANYTRFMPDGSYLDATKLRPKELVRQIFEIMNEPESYYEFFKWHNHYSYHAIEDSPDTDPFCKLCDYINKMELDNISSVVYEFEDWWNPHFNQWISFYE